MSKAMKVDTAAAELHDELYEPLRAFVERALVLLRTILRENPSWFNSLEWPYWHRDDDGVFRNAGAQILWSSSVERQIEALAEHSNATRLLGSHPLASTHLDALVGTMRGGSRLDTSAFLESLIRSSVRPSDEFAFQIDLFDARFREFIDWLISETVEAVTIAPLSGVGGDASGPIVLSDISELDRLTEAELTRALSVGVIRPFGSSPIFVNEPSVWGLRVRHRWTKLVGERAFDNPEQQAERDAEILRSEPY